MTSNFMRCVPMRWDEVRDVAIAIVRAFWTLRGESCPDDVSYEAARKETAEIAAVKRGRYLA